MLKIFPILYKFTSSGKIQSWKITAIEESGVVSYSSCWGQQNGSFQTTTITIDEGKNIGKANETTPFEQACSEAESKWKKQLDKGYSQGAPKALPAVMPMLAKSFDKEKKKVTFPCFWQPKLDGMRCVAQKINGKVTMFSRKGKLIDTLPHISSLLEALMDDGEITDGELYTHGVTFQKTMSWVKRAQPDSVKVQYHIYDMINDKPFRDRFKRICRLVGHNGNGIIRTVHTSVVGSFEGINTIHTQQTKRGFEGIMLRLGTCDYRIGRRSSDLLKVKKFLDEEFEIVDAYENKGRHIGQCTLVCKTSQGATFGVKPMGSEAEREQIWTDFQAGKIEGEFLTVRFFEWTTSNPKVPRFPIGIWVRPKWDM